MVGCVSVSKILIIEDEAQTRNVFLRCLEIEGFETCAASNALDGLALAFSEQPDLIVCDILMPDQTGYFVLSKLRRSPQTAAIPFIFLTAKVTMSELRQGMQLGADDYLTKPCTVEQFLEAIAVRLQRHQEVMKAQLSTAAVNPYQLAEEQSSPSENLDFCFPRSETLTPIFKFIETHYNQSVKLDDIAREVGYSPAYLTNLVQKETGRTIKQWIIARRMMQARKLLRNTTRTVKEVANNCGYPDAGYFTSQFRKFHDETPLNWRKTATVDTK